MARHTTMPPRNQRTPHGDVTLTSRWKNNKYWLVVYGPVNAVRWLFPKADGFEFIGDMARHTFVPAPMPVTVERSLRQICAQWQDAWNIRYEDESAGITTQPIQAGPTITTLGQLFDHLYQQRLATLKASTASRDIYRLKVWRDTLGNGCPLATLTAGQITVALAQIGKRTSPVTANVALALLKTFLTWAANTGLLKDQCHKTVRRLPEPSANARHRAWWTMDEVNLALRCASQDDHQPTATLLVACGCYLGLRVEEIIMLRWQDLSLDATDPKTGEPRPVCHITPNGGWTPKDGEARDIPICSELLAILQQHRQAEGYLLQAEPGRPGRPRGGKGWIYRYDPRKVWARIMKLVVAGGGKAITMYGMRHSFASNFLIARVSDVKVARWLGHTDTRMVHRHYGHLLSYDGDINALSAYRPLGET